MKKRTLFLSVIFLSVFLSACGGKTAELSEKQEGQVAEYAAKVTLKYVRGYEPTLMEEVAVEENPSAEKENFKKIGDNSKNAENTPQKGSISDTQSTSANNSQNSSGSSVTKNNKNTGNLNSLIAKEGFEVTYSGSGEYSRYPENEGYFSLVAGYNMKLYVVKFAIKNKTDKDKRYKKEKDVGYSLTFDGTNFYKPSLTLLENDMQSIDVFVKAGKSAKGVLVFDVKKKETNKPQLKIFKGDETQMLDL